MEYSYRDELYHHGIKGQKWGVRRYQNEDGSLTAAGQKRYISDGEGNYKRITGRMKRAQKVYDRVHSVRDDTRRMARMSDRQKKSLDNAEKYWKSRAEGNKPEERRNLIQRHYDKTRSFNKYERAGRKALRQIMTNAVYQSRLPDDYRLSKGETVANSLKGTMTSIAVDELRNKVFGHF